MQRSFIPGKTSRVILTAAMAGVLGVDVGDDVTVQTPLGTDSLVVGGLADELISSVIYVNLKRSSHPTRHLCLFLRLLETHPLPNE